MKVFLDKIVHGMSWAKFREKRCEVGAHRCTLAQVQANADPCVENAVSCVSALHVQMRS
jgi:hypothetical protein